MFMLGTRGKRHTKGNFRHIGDIFDKMVPVLEAAEEKWLKASRVSHCCNFDGLYYFDATTWLNPGGYTSTKRPPNRGSFMIEAMTKGRLHSWTYMGK